MIAFLPTVCCFCDRHSTPGWTQEVQSSAEKVGSWICCGQEEASCHSELEGILAEAWPGVSDILLLRSEYMYWKGDPKKQKGFAVLRQHNRKQTCGKWFSLSKKKKKPVCACVLYVHMHEFIWIFISCVHAFISIYYTHTQILVFPLKIHIVHNLSTWLKWWPPGQPLISVKMMNQMLGRPFFRTGNIGKQFL